MAFRRFRDYIFSFFRPQPLSIVGRDQKDQSSIEEVQNRDNEMKINRTYLDENYLIVAAIDFGTTHCGYGFAFKGDPKKLFMNKIWPGSTMSTEKAPTSVLTGPEKEFIAFGFEAEEKYVELQQNEEKDCDKYSLFKYFKLELHKEKLSLGNKIQAVDGNEAKAIDIFAMTLKYLKDQLINTIKQSGNIKENLDESDIRWVITVPAIWKDEAKSFMRSAAFKAGCISSLDSRKLLIALEPEAASLECRSLNYTGYKTKTNSEGNVDSIPLCENDAKYMVIDGGGGTVDMTVHKVLQDRNIEEIHQSVGEICGSVLIDKEFEKLLTKAVGGPDFINYFKKKFPATWLSFMKNFEHRKINFKPETNNYKLRVELPYIMFEKFKEKSKSKKTLVNEITEKSICGTAGYSCQQGCFTIDNETTCQLFKGAINETTNLTKNILRKDKVSYLSYILLVGGFAECHLLQDEIKKILPKGTTLLVPLEPHLAVLKGAISFGLNPYCIQKRVARMSYGTDRMHKFTPGKHDIKRKKNIEGMAWCDDIFDPFVKKGDTVQSGTVIERKMTRVYKNQKHMTLDIYRVDRSDLAEVEYIDGNGMQCVGQIYIPLSDKQGAVKVKMVFGATEIYVSATDENSGETTLTAVDFLSYLDTD